MKRIIILSDTHGHSQPVRRALAQEAAAKHTLDALVFLGDGWRDIEFLESEYPTLPVYAVRGNCDFGCQFAPTGLIPFEGSLIFYTHGHLHGVKYDRDELAQKALAAGADIALFGHTHLPMQDELASVTLFNPGSAGQPRNGVASYGVLSLQRGETPVFEHKAINEPAW